MRRVEGDSGMGNNSKGYIGNSKETVSIDLLCNEQLPDREDE